MTKNYAVSLHVRREHLCLRVFHHYFLRSEIKGECLTAIIRHLNFINECNRKTLRLSFRRFHLAGLGIASAHINIPGGGIEGARVYKGPPGVWQGRGG